MKVKIENKTFEAKEHEFNSGSTGYYASEVREINGRKYSIKVYIIEVGSKYR